MSLIKAEERELLKQRNQPRRVRQGVSRLRTEEVKASATTEAKPGEPAGKDLIILLEQ